MIGNDERSFTMNGFSGIFPLTAGGFRVFSGFNSHTVQCYSKDAHCSSLRFTHPLLAIRGHLSPYSPRVLGRGWELGWRGIQSPV